MKFTKEHLSKYDWVLLARLLAKNEDVKTCLKLIGSFDNNKRIKEIEKLLEQGLSLKAILMKDALEREIGSYSEFVELRKAIEIACERQQQRRKLNRLLWDKLSYSMIVFVASLIVLSIFTDQVLPMMLSIASLEHSGSIMIGFQMIGIVKNIVLILMAIFIALFAYLKLKRKWAVLWMLLHKFNRDHLIKIIATYQFVQEMIVLLQSDMTLMDCLQYLRYHSEKPLAAVIAANMHYDLLSGKEFQQTLQNAFFDESFAQVILFELQKDDFKESLMRYKDIIEERLKIQISRYSLILQIGCYGFVSVVIILAYRLLLIPLEMLNSI